MKVLLIETSATDRPGSMQRFADLIELALADDPEIQILRTCLAPTAQQLRRYPQRLRMPMHHATIAWRARSLQQQIPADVYHLVDGSHAYVLRWLKRRRSTVTVHDIIPQLQSEGRFAVPAPSRGARWLIRSSLRSLTFADRIMADSLATAQDVGAAQPAVKERVQVVPLAVPPSLLPPPGIKLPNWNMRQQHGRPFLFHIGNNGFYKNRAGVVRVFDRVRQTVSCRLVMAGPPPDAALTALIRERQLGDDVEFVVDPSDADVLNLYRMARLLLFPSYYEGFGWPPLEAMAWGCPVVCSRSGSLPEVVGDAALNADVDNEAELAAHCLRILSDQAVAESFVAAGAARVEQFSLENFRRDLKGVYRSLV